jgi:hypothetical protein
VAAVLAVGLREHHQLDVGRVALQLAVGLDQVVDLVLGQRQAHLDIGRGQRAAPGGDIDKAQRLGRQFLEQAGGIVTRGDHGLGHAGVRVQRLAAAQQALLADDRDFDTALDAVDMREAAVMGDVGGLAGPRRDRAEARDHHEAVAVRRIGKRRAVGQQRRHAGLLFGRQRRLCVDKVQELAMHRFNIGVDLPQGGEQALLTEGGKRQSAGEAREMRHDRSGREAVR